MDYLMDSVRIGGGMLAFLVVSLIIAVVMTGKE